MSILRAILFIVVVYLLIRFVSNMFLPSKKKKRSKVRFFYNTFKNVRDQQKQQQQQQKQNMDPEDRLDEIEEAEYEDITDDEKTSSK